MADKNLAHTLEPAPGAKAVGIKPVDMSIEDLNDVEVANKANNDVLQWDSTDSKYKNKQVASGGLSQAQVDARVAAGVADWAETGNATAIPAGKLTNAPAGLSQAQVDARVAAGVANWAENANTDIIPSNKLPTILTQAQVDARVAAGVADWAETDNTAQIPTAKLGNARTQTQVDAQIKSVVEDWAEVGNTTAIPANKLGNAISQAQVDARVKAGVLDWAETGNTTAIPANKLTNAPSGQTQAQVDARVKAGVADWAETGNTSQIPLNKLGNAPSGGGGGLSQAQVDARVAAGVANWAEQGNTTLIPANKLTNAPGLTQAEVDTRVQEGVADWAEDGNTDNIPANKLGNAISQTQVDARVKAGVLNWAETGNTDPIPVAKLTNAQTQAQVDARVKAGVSDWAENANTDIIPSNKLPTILTQAQVDARVDAGVSDWAEQGNTDQIPLNKLGNAPSGGGGGLSQSQVDARVAAGVADWAENGNTSVIPSNKLPTILTQAQVDARVAAGVADWAEDGNTSVIPSNKLPTILTQAQVDARVQAGVSDWAEDGNTDDIPANKLGNVPAGITQAQVDARVTAGVADWAETDNKDQIPKSKLGNVPGEVIENIEDFTMNNLTVLRDIKTAGTASSVQLPTDFANYHYLLIGGSSNSEYGIIDVRYLNVRDTLTSIEGGTYLWNKLTRTITGTVKGAYLFKLDAKNFDADNDWLYASTTGVRSTPTTTANDGFGSIDPTNEQADSHNFFAFRVWDVGTIQFLPRAVYDNIASGSSSIFRVWDENNTKTLRVTKGANFDFDSYNESTSSSANDLRSAAFVTFPKVNVLRDSTSSPPTTLTLPEHYDENDLLIAVTKQPSEAWYTIWTIKARFANRTITPSTRVFNPAAGIIYAALVKIETKLEIEASEVRVDDDALNKIEGDNVQEALESIDTQIGVTTTPNNGTELPTTAIDGDEFNLTADYVADGADIQTQSLAQTFFAGQGWGTFGFASYKDTQGTLNSIGHTSEPLPDGILGITNNRLIVRDDTNTDLLGIVLTKGGVKTHRSLTRSNQTDFKIDGSQFAPNVDYYTFNADLPAGPWEKLYFLRTGGSGTQETYTSPAVTGKVYGAVTKKKGVYRRKESLWQAQDYNAPEADPSKQLSLTCEETLPGTRQDKNATFVNIAGSLTVNAPFPGIVNIYFEQRSEQTNTLNRWVISTPHDIPDDHFPKIFRYDSTNYSLKYFETDVNTYKFISSVIGEIQNRPASSIPKNINIQLESGEWLGVSNEKKLNKTLHKDDLGILARSIPNIAVLPPVEYGVAGQVVYLLETKVVRGNGRILTRTGNLTSGRYSGQAFAVGFTSTIGTMFPEPDENIVSILSYLDFAGNSAATRNKVIITKAASAAAFTQFWLNGREYDLTAVTGMANSYAVTGLDGNTFIDGEEYVFNIKQTDWLYADNTLLAKRYYIWDRFNFQEFTLVPHIKQYAQQGATEAKIPFTDYGTHDTVANINAIASSALLRNHLYVGT